MFEIFIEGEESFLLLIDIEYWFLCNYSCMQSITQTNSNKDVYAWYDVISGTGHLPPILAFLLT